MSALVPGMNPVPETVSAEPEASLRVSGPEAGVGPAAARLVIFEFYIYICIAKQFKLA